MVYLSRARLLFAIVLCVICYNEWISYEIKSKSWLKLEETDDSISILLIADPQILSIISEPLYPLSIIAIWDANRFLSKAYSYAVKHTKPDIVIFLGDLINDGSIATDDDFISMVANFKNLLPEPPSAKVIFYIAGDNDVGGEGNDPVTSSKIKRFESSFNATSIISHKFLEIYHVNNIYGSISSLAKQSTGDSERLPIFVSHFPITPATKKEVINKIVEIGPRLLFSAHNHDSYRFVSTKDNPRAHQFHLLRADITSPLKLDLNSPELNEISVPTCSYRMGKQYYGFGHARITQKGTMEYLVLWLPSRFGQLWLYFVLVCFCCSFYIWPLVLFCARRYEMRRNKIHRM